MMHRNTHAKEALSGFAKTGATLPKPVATAVGIRARVSEQIQATHEAHRLMGRSMYEAFANDTVDSAELASATLRSGWVPLLGSVELTADDEVTRAVVTHADALVVALREVFDPLALTLSAAHEVLGDVDIRRHHEHILGLGAKGFAAWAQAIDAAERILPISYTWQAIATAARWRLDTEVAAFNLVKWDAARWLDTRPDSRVTAFGSSAWDATRTGWSLHLYSRSELAEFDAAVTDEEHRREGWLNAERSQNFTGTQPRPVPAAAQRAEAAAKAEDQQKSAGSGRRAPAY